MHIDSTHGNYRMVLWWFGQSKCCNKNWYARAKTTHWMFPRHSAAESVVIVLARSPNNAVNENNIMTCSHRFWDPMFPKLPLIFLGCRATVIAEQSFVKMLHLKSFSDADCCVIATHLNNLEQANTWWNTLILTMVEGWNPKFHDFDTKSLTKTLRTCAMTGPVPKCWVGCWMRWIWKATKFLGFHVLFI